MYKKCKTFLLSYPTSFQIYMHITVIEIEGVSWGVYCKVLGHDYFAYPLIIAIYLKTRGMIFACESKVFKQHNRG